MDSSRPSRSQPLSFQSASTQSASTQQVSTQQIGTNVDDSELVARILSGDSWAKEAFYRKHVAQAYRVARRLVGHGPDAEDVVQEAFSQAFVDLPHLRNPDTLRSWFLRIVVNRAHRKFRRRRVLKFFGWGADFEWDDFETSGQCPADVAAELTLVSSVLENVPASARTAWVLRRVEGCSLAEVAEACGCSLATIKRRIASVDECVNGHVFGSGPREDVPTTEGRR